MTKETKLEKASQQHDLKELVEYVLKKAKQQGATQAEVGASISDGFSVTTRLAEVETLEHHKNKGFGITVYFGNQKGSTSTSDLSQTAIDEAIAKACSIAKFTSEDECNGLAEPDLMAYGYKDLNLYYPWDITPAEAIEHLIECEQKALTSDKRIINSEGASLATHKATSVYANSHGFLGEVQGSRYDISLVLIAREKDSMERDYAFSVVRDPADLKKFSWLADEAVRKTIKRLSPQKIKTQKVPVIFDSEIAPGLLNNFFSAIKGGNLYRRASFLVDHLHKQIFPANLTIIENPFIPKGLASAAFDAEGVRTAKREIIKDGILTGYVLGSYSARKLGMQSTGNAGGIHNIEIATPLISKAELLAKMGKGLLITEVMGQGVNIVTGDYSRGASGFWVENGEIQYPVSEITIAGNLKDMFAQIIGFANDYEENSSIRTGSVLIEEMMVAGT